jgi:hypothetical protein
MTINTQKLRKTARLLSSHRWNCLTPLGVEEVLAAADHIDAQTAEIARLRYGIEEAIRLLGMDRPIDPTDTLRAALSGESHD